MSIFELSSVTSRWTERSLECSTAFNTSKENAGKASVGVAELADSSAGCERVQALAGEKGVKMLGERDGERKLHDSQAQSATP